MSRAHVLPRITDSTGESQGSAKALPHTDKNAGCLHDAPQDQFHPGVTEDTPDPLAATDVDLLLPVTDLALVLDLAHPGPTDIPLLPLAATGPVPAPGRGPSLHPGQRGPGQGGRDTGERFTTTLLMIKLLGEILSMTGISE